MLSLARTCDQENLVKICKDDMFALAAKIEDNYFINLTRDSDLISSNAVILRRTKSGRVLTVSHFVPNDTVGMGLIQVYKADHQLWNCYKEKSVLNRW